MAPKPIAAVAALGVALADPALAQSQQAPQGGSGSSSPQRREGRERGWLAGGLFD